MSNKNDLNETPNEEGVGLEEEEFDLGLSLEDAIEETSEDNAQEDLALNLDEDMDLSLEDEFDMDAEKETSIEEDEQETPDVADVQDLTNCIKEVIKVKEAEEQRAEKEAIDEFSSEDAPMLVAEEIFMPEEDDSAEMDAFDDDINLMMDDDDEEVEVEEEPVKEPEKPKKDRNPNRTQANPYRSNTTYAQYKKEKPQGGKRIVGVGQTSSTRNTRADMTIVGYGRTRFSMKVFGFVVILALAYAIGLIAQSVAQKYGMQYMYAIQYLPIVNTGCMLLYYFMFSVRKFSYRKKYANKISVPTPRDKRSMIYRTMNSGYYTFMRAIIWLVFVMILDASIIVGANQLYDMVKDRLYDVFNGGM